MIEKEKEKAVVSFGFTLSPLYNLSHDKLRQDYGKNYMIDCGLAFAFVNCLPM